MIVTVLGIAACFVAAAWIDRFLARRRKRGLFREWENGASPGAVPGKDLDAADTEPLRVDKSN